MMALRKLFYLGCFAALALTAALAMTRIGEPSMAPLLARAVVVATLAAAPGLLHRRAWPVALVLLPLGAYLVVRTQLPLPASVHGAGQQWSFYTGQLRSALDVYATEKFPFDLSRADDLQLLISLVVYAATGLAAFAALGLRKAAPAVIILLVPLGFALTVDGVDRVIWLPLAYLLLAGCLLALSRSLKRERWRAGDLLAGASTAVIASLLALFVVGATPVEASTPLQDWRSWGTAGATASHVRFDWMQNYPSLLDADNKVVVMKVTSPVASYWRANALDSFDGRIWSNQWGATGVAGERSGASFVYSIPGDQVEPPGKSVTEEFAIRSLYTDYLFSGGVPKTLVFSDELPLGVNWVLGLQVAGVEGHALGPHFDYKLTAVVPTVKPAALAGLGRDYPANVLSDLAMPFATARDVTSQEEWDSILVWGSHSEWAGLYQLNQTIVGDATDPYEIALRIERYLRDNYTYSLEPPATHLSSPYAAFLLHTHTGYCQHFAGAMALLLRFNGVPARVAVGFTTGKAVGNDTYEVSTNDAHAWVEAFFPGIGWLPFEPTPGDTVPAGGVSSTAPAFVNPFESNGGPSPAPSPAPSPSGGGGGQKPDVPGGAGGGAAGSSGLPGWAAWLIAVAAVVVVWPPLRALVRRRRLHRGGLEERLRASLGLVYAVLHDYGVNVPSSETLDETSHLMREELGLEAAPLTARVQSVFFGGRAATQGDLADVAALRGELRRRLRARAGWLRWALALYGLRLAAR
jgi:protein-glutamine gamma-glutamyltransferase